MEKGCTMPVKGESVSLCVLAGSHLQCLSAQWEPAPGSPGSPTSRDKGQHLYKALWGKGGSYRRHWHRDAGGCQPAHSVTLQPEAFTQKYSILLEPLDPRFSPRQGRRVTNAQASKVAFGFGHGLENPPLPARYLALSSHRKTCHTSQIYDPVPVTSHL